MATIQLWPEWKELFELFNAEKVEYLLVGGFAVIHYGYHRGTDDIDIWIKPSVENSKAVSAALQRFGFNSITVEPVQFQQPSIVFQIGIPPFQVHLLTYATGLTFKSAYEASEQIELDGVHLRVICRADLLINKKSSGRPKDLIDIDELSP